MATSIIKCPEIVTKTTFTPAYGSSYAAFGGCYYEKYGHIIHLHIGISGLTAKTGRVVLVLPEAFRPSAGILQKCIADNVDKMGNLEVRTNGEVYVNTQGTYIGADVMWFV